MKVNTFMENWFLKQKQASVWLCILNTLKDTLMENWFLRQKQVSTGCSYLILCSLMSVTASDYSLYCKFFIKSAFLICERYIHVFNFKLIKVNHCVKFTWTYNNQSAVIKCLRSESKSLVHDVQLVKVWHWNGWWTKYFRMEKWTTEQGT